MTESEKISGVKAKKLTARSVSWRWLKMSKASDERKALKERKKSWRLSKSNGFALWPRESATCTQLNHEKDM